MNKSFQKIYEDRTSLVSIIELQNNEIPPEDEQLILENFKNQMITELKRVEFLFFQNTKYYHIRIHKMKEQLDFIAKINNLKILKSILKSLLKNCLKN